MSLMKARVAPRRQNPSEKCTSLAKAKHLHHLSPEREMNPFLPHLRSRYT